MSIAENLFKSYAVYGKIEDSILNIIHETFQESGWHDMSFDWSDNSLEVYGVENNRRLSSEEVQKFLDLGFSIIYINHRDGYETHYSQSSLDGWRTPEARHRAINEDSDTKTKWKMAKEIERLKQFLPEKHYVACNYQSKPLGSEGCICYRLQRDLIFSAQELI